MTERCLAYNTGSDSIYPFLVRLVTTREEGTDVRHFGAGGYLQEELISLSRERHARIYQIVSHTQFIRFFFYIHVCFMTLP